MPVGLYHVQYGNHYPFVNPKPENQDFFVDLSISYEDPKWEYDLPLHLTYFRNDRIILKTNSGELFFDSKNRTPIVSMYDDQNYKMLHWNADTIQVKAVINNNNSFPKEEIDEVLDIRTTVCIPPHLRKVRIVSNGKTSQWYDRNIQLVAGHNIELNSTARDTFRSSNEITIAAVAGAGTGRLPAECNTAKSGGVKAINGATPDEHGTIFLEFREGHSAQPNCPNNGNTNVINLSNTNKPCCKCPDYYTLARYIRLVADQYMELGGQAIWMRDQHNEMIKQWRQIPLLSNVVAIHIQMVKTSFPYFQIRLSVTNITPMCLRELNIQYEVHGSVSDNRIKLQRAIVTQEKLECGQSVGITTRYIRPDEKDTLAKGEVRRELVTGAPTRLVHVYAAPALSGMHWDYVTPSKTACWTSVYRILPPTPHGRYEPEIQIHFELTRIHARFDNLVAMRGTRVPVVCTWDQGVKWCVSNPEVINGDITADLVLELKDKEIIDPEPSKEDVEEIKEEIYEIKRELWPCPTCDDLKPIPR